MDPNSTPRENSTDEPFSTVLFIKGTEQKKLSLEDFRNDLIRQEETIIFALIERAQFKQNSITYKPGGVTENIGSLSFLDFFFGEIERVHSMMRRYTSPDEHPFYTDKLVPPIIPLLKFPVVIKPNTININNQIKSIYLNKIIPSICAEGDDNQFGSSVNMDINALQAISKRVHYGKFIAEAKFQSESEKYGDRIRKGDVEGLRELLTNLEVEKKVLERIHLKASTYGRDVTATQNQKFKVDPDAIVAVYRDFIIPLNKDVQIAYLLQRLDDPQVAYLGPPSTFSHQAALQHFGDKLNGTPCATISEVFLSVMANKTFFGVVPVENSIAGRVQETLGQLFEAQVRIVGDLYLKITQNLISQHALNEIEILYTHPHAYEQCRSFIAKYLPTATFISTKSTSAAAELVAEMSAAGEKCACIASDLAAREFNLPIVQTDIQDHKQNTTRFLVIAKEDISSSPSGQDLTWIVFGVHNVTGALSDALLIFAKHGINMNALDTRPNKSRDWQYDFLVEIQGHEQDLNVKTAISELKLKTPFLNVMGSIQNRRAPIVSPMNK